ncbi:hypothetical protein Syun_028939 [Stephania yunnanensis]|uniref:PORR domain-containing protein n=1 Tax=Stephania yunnanensis TaxID=152371 RepID=A0AAP0E4G7_9MAGN
MLSIRSIPLNPSRVSPNPSPNPQFTLQFAPISSLKVVWRKDRKLDQAIENDKQWRLCSKVVKEVLNEPAQVIPLRYLEKRRERLRLPIKIKTFLNRYPGLFDTYPDRIKPKTQLVEFVLVSDRLRRFLDDEHRVREENERGSSGFRMIFCVVWCPSTRNSFGWSGNPGEGKSFLELVSWNDEFGKSVIERRAEEESRLTGVSIRPAFDWRLPSGFFIKKEMREWVRDWMELPYVSPYADASHLDQASPEMEKRTVGVLHELLSLSLLKRMPVPIVGKLREEYRLSNAFASVFTRHSGIFYMSLKNGIKTGVLREAYENEELVDRDPLLEIKDKFVELLDEGQRMRAEQMRAKRQAIRMEMEMVAIRNVDDS